MNSTISIPRTLANRLLSLAQLNPNIEICGLIACAKNKDKNKQYKVYPVNNIATNNECVFEMDPQQQISAFKKIRENQQSLFAIYHSHPNSDALPSKKDINDSAYNDALNIIISLKTKGVIDMRGYFYNEDNAQKIKLIIE